MPNKDRRNQYTPEQAELFKKYSAENPHVSNAKLAQIIYNTTGLLSVDYLKRKITLWSKESLASNEVSFHLPDDEFDMPESWYIPIPVFTMPKNIKNLGIIGDVHIPFHDIAAFGAAVKYLKNSTIDALLINGDLSDMYCQSRWEKDGKFVKPDAERDLVIKTLASLRKYFPNIPIYYKLGNHELRLQKYIRNQAPELQGSEDLLFKNWMKFYASDIEEINGYSRIEYGKLNIWHGHELNISGGINIARTVLLKTMVNTLINHVHRSQTFTQPKGDNKYISSTTVGCLCGRTPEYAPVNQWNHGFAIVERDDSDNFIVHNKIIINGVVR